ncbi:hypothetical protein FACS1894132_12170 [Clostridia bacterium]|nr:hypothetical protein FACS1894132_12170 [Clostridia bacterium]
MKLKKVLAFSTVFILLCSGLVGCKDKNKTADSASGVVVGGTTTAGEWVRPDYVNDGKETVCKIGETVNWNNTGATFTFESAGITEENSAIIFNIVISNGTDKNINLSLLDKDNILIYNGETKLDFNYKTHIAAMKVAKNYFIIDDSQNYLYKPSTTNYWHIPALMPSNLSEKFKISMFPDYNYSPDYVTFEVDTKDLKTLTPVL